MRNTGCGTIWAGYATGSMAWEAMGNNGFGNFWAGHTTGARTGKQWKAMDLVTFGLGIPLGRAGKQWEATGSNGKQREATGSNGIDWIR